MQHVRQLGGRLLVAAACLVLPVNGMAEGWLGLPVDCQVGENCWPLQHFDHDPGPGALDFTCGGQAYDTHKGVDIGLATVAEIENNVAVLAAAEGRVLAVRDGETDGLVLRGGLAALPKGRDCGNGVLIDHGDGWRTQYCHLRAGSVAVKPGDRVPAGARLGAIGLSGRTQFPHLHLSVRHNDAPVDPYAPDGVDAAHCKAPKGEGLWTDAAAKALAYAPLSLVAVGLAEGRPTLDKAAAGAYRRPKIDRDAGALVAWGVAWHVKAGDRAIFEIDGPDGRRVLRREVEIAQGRLRQLIYAGARATGQWPPGDYVASVSIVRSDGVSRRRSFKVRVE